MNWYLLQWVMVAKKFIVLFFAFECIWLFPWKFFLKVLKINFLRLSDITFILLIDNYESENKYSAETEICIFKYVEKLISKYMWKCPIIFLVLFLEGNFLFSYLNIQLQCYT